MPPYNEVVFVKDKANRVLLQNYVKPKGQTRQLLEKQTVGMLITGILLAAYVDILYIYESKGAVDHPSWVIFNTLTTAVLIALGLNFFGVFKTVAKVLRWRFLSGRYVEVREADLILGAESLSKIFKLILEFPRKYFTVAVCAGWLLLNLGAQTLVATVQLNVSMDGGHDSNGATNTSGPVCVPRLDCFYPTDSGVCQGDNSTQIPSIAHAYGEGSRQSKYGCNYDGDAHAIEGPQNCSYFAKSDRSEFAVRFADYNPEDSTGAYPYLNTGRVLIVSASNCAAILGPPSAVAANGQDGPGSEFIYSFPPGPEDDGKISIPRTLLAAQATTYVWNGTRLPGDPSDPLPYNACGARCVRLFALRDYWEGTTHNIATFQCDVSVSDVSKASDTQIHTVPDEVARTAAAAITLTGRWRALNYAQYAIPGNATLDWRQFQLYQEGADWAAQHGDSADEVGALMAEFAAATLGNLAKRNPRVETNGVLPELGNTLNVKWQNVKPLIGVIVATHVLLVGLTLLLSHTVAVGDDSHLVVGHLLRDVVADLPSEDDEKVSLARLDGKVLAADISETDGTEMARLPVASDEASKPFMDERTIGLSAANG